MGAPTFINSHAPELTSDKSTEVLESYPTQINNMYPTKSYIYLNGDSSPKLIDRD